LEQGAGLYDPQKHLSYTFLYEEDPEVCRLAQGPALWLLGYPDQALVSIRNALTLAHEISHPYSLALALAQAATLHQCRRETRLTQEHAETVITFSIEKGFPYWAAWGTLVRGWVLTEQEQGEEGIAQLHQGMAAYQATGAELCLPLWLAMLAEAYGKVGQTEAGLTALAEALATAHRTGERWWEAEIHRLKGSCS